MLAMSFIFEGILLSQCVSLVLYMWLTSNELFHEFVLMHLSDELAGNDDPFIVGMSERMKKNFS